MTEPTRLETAEPCPYHRICPEIEKTTAREAIDKTYFDMQGNERKYILPRLDLYRVFCPACRDSDMRMFGRGFLAQDMKKAVSKWNRACASANLRILTKTVRGGMT